MGLGNLSWSWIYTKNDIKYCMGPEWCWECPVNPIRYIRFPHRRQIRFVKAKRCDSSSNLLIQMKWVSGNGDQVHIIFSPRFGLSKFEKQLSYWPIAWLTGRQVKDGQLWSWLRLACASLCIHPVPPSRQKWALHHRRPTEKGKRDRKVKKQH